MGYYLKIKDLLDNQAIVVGKTEEWIASLEGLDSIDANIRNIISSVSHIVSISYPKGENIRDSYLNMRTFLTGLNEQIIAYEESHISE